MEASSHEVWTSADGDDGGASGSGRASPAPVPPLPPTEPGALSCGLDRPTAHHHTSPLQSKEEHDAAVRGGKALMKQGSVVMDWVTQFDDVGANARKESEAVSVRHAQSRCDVFLVRCSRRGSQRLAVGALVGAQRSHALAAPHSIHLRSRPLVQ